VILLVKYIRHFPSLSLSYLSVSQVPFGMVVLLFFSLSCFPLCIHFLFSRAFAFAQLKFCYV
jgi:hypothetical protein